MIQARPLWNTPLLPLQFAVTAFAGAVGLALLFNRFGVRDAAANRRMAPACWPRARWCWRWVRCGWRSV